MASTIVLLLDITTANFVTVRFPYQMMFVSFNSNTTVPHVEQDLLTLPKHMSSPPVFSAVSVALIPMQYFVDYCLSFRPLHFLSFFHLQLLITPMVSSNISDRTLFNKVLISSEKTYSKIRQECICGCQILKHVKLAIVFFYRLIVNRYLYYNMT